MTLCVPIVAGILVVVLPPRRVPDSPPMFSLSPFFVLGGGGGEGVGVIIGAETVGAILGVWEFSVGRVGICPGADDEAKGDEDPVFKANGDGEEEEVGRIILSVFDIAKVDVGLSLDVEGSPKGG